MTSLWIPLVLLALTVPLVLALVRANELFCVRVRWDEGGEARVSIVRGRLPQKLLDDIAGALRGGAAAVRSEALLVRVVHEDGRPSVYVEGELGAAHRQRLKNTISLWPVARIRNAPRR